MASSSRSPLTLFPDLNEATRERTGAVVLEPQPNDRPSSPVRNYPEMTMEQIMATQSDMEANSYTLKSCMETMTAVTNLSRRLQNRTFEAYQLSAQLSLLQQMYKDARGEISALKKENKELKRQVTSKARFGVSSYSAFDGQRGVITFGSATKAEAESSKTTKARDEAGSK